MAAMLLYALFTQYVQGLQPCNMCLLQRLAVAVVGTLFLLAAIYHPRVALARVYAVLMGVGASAGVSLAARQVWMQAQPLGSLPSCGADLYTLMDLLPVHQAVLLVWNGGGDCQAVTWSLWGLSMAGWVAISLSIIGILGILNNIRHD
jgi:disulfide bond formation protein DsbB